MARTYRRLNRERSSDYRDWSYRVTASWRLPLPADGSLCTRDGISQTEYNQSVKLGLRAERRAAKLALKNY